MNRLQIHSESSHEVEISRLVLFVVLSCVRGGGSSSNVVASTLAFPLRQININQLVNSSSVPFKVSGTINVDSVTGSGNITYSGLSNATFEGKPALKQTATVTGTTTSNGKTSPVNSSGNTYVDLNYVLLDEIGDYYTIYTNHSVPTRVHVNDTGTLLTRKRYTLSITRPLFDTVEVTYLVEADTATTALLSTIYTHKDINGAFTGGQTINQYRIGADGTSTRVQSTVSLNTSTSKGNLVYTF